jgi:hypothetical protein
VVRIHNAAARIRRRQRAVVDGKVDDDDVFVAASVVAVSRVQGVTSIDAEVAVLESRHYRRFVLFGLLYARLIQAAHGFLQKHGEARAVRLIR